jgi:hypothetical protein
MVSSLSGRRVVIGDDVNRGLKAVCQRDSLRCESLRTLC